MSHNDRVLGEEVDLIIHAGYVTQGYVKARGGQSATEL